MGEVSSLAGPFQGPGAVLDDIKSQLPPGVSQFVPGSAQLPAFMQAPRNPAQAGGELGQGDLEAAADNCEDNWIFTSAQTAETEKAVLAHTAVAVTQKASSVTNMVMGTANYNDRINQVQDNGGNVLDVGGKHGRKQVVELNSDQEKALDRKKWLNGGGPRAV